jgi:predicted ribosomally synthesized peptide with SipW-like signal peptide
MKVKNKYIFTIITFTLVVTGVVLGLTLSAFTSKDVVTNKFMAGEILTQIIEKDQDDNEFDKDMEIDQGQEIVKKVYIKNPSKVDSLVRVSITTRWVDPNDDSKVLPINYGDVQLNFDDGIETNSNLNWYKGNDGYYYYKKVLKGCDNIEGKDITEILLKSVKFSQTIDNFYNNMKFKVDVKAEAVEPTRVENSDGTFTYNYSHMWGNINQQEIHQLLKGLVDSKYIND